MLAISHNIYDMKVSPVIAFAKAKPFRFLRAFTKESMGVVTIRLGWWVENIWIIENEERLHNRRCA